MSCMEPVTQPSPPDEIGKMLDREREYECGRKSDPGPCQSDMLTEIDPERWDGMS